LFTITLNDPGFVSVLADAAEGLEPAAAVEPAPPDPSEAEPVEEAEFDAPEVLSPEPQAANNKAPAPPPARASAARREKISAVRCTVIISPFVGDM
jgi:hypothetical protein